jgi:hypothetical protein
MVQEKLKTVPSNWEMVADMDNLQIYNFLVLFPQLEWGGRLVAWMGFSEIYFFTNLCFLGYWE